MTATSQELATRAQNGPAALIKQYESRLSALLPDHRKAEAWMRMASGTLRDPKLREAAESDPMSFMGALQDCAALGLSPGTKQYYMIPQKEKGKLKVRGQTGYQGEIELIYNAGAVSSVIVEAVYTGDQFDYQPGVNDRPIHRIDWAADDRGQIYLAYAYGIMKDGAVSKVVIVNKTRIARAKESSQGSDSPYSPWVRDEAAMWLKTAVHDLTKFVPTSAELRSITAARAEAERAHVLANPTAHQQATPTTVHAPAGDEGVTVTADVVTGEVVEDPPADPWNGHNGDPA
jgi:recombination protein RecT